MLANIRCGVRRRQSVVALRRRCASSGFAFCRSRCNGTNTRAPQEVLAQLAMAPQGHCCCTLNVLDLFTTSQAIANAARKKGYMAQAYGLDLDPKEDFLTEVGMAKAWAKVRSVKTRHQGVVFAQPPCKMWLQFMTLPEICNKTQHGRTIYPPRSTV